MSAQDDIIIYPDMVVPQEALDFLEYLNAALGYDGQDVGTTKNEGTCQPSIESPYSKQN